uniref:Ketoreductase domain-containing protein n=1 Tax=Falco tinnunculus TaxID=100819 RepID=A0A8C4XKV0_FALTI
MAPKTVLITGCSSGIGLALAVRLARDKQRRFRVIATMRNVGRSGALAAAAGPALGRTLEIKQLDVCDEDSIRACLNSIPGRHIDVLVSNAGVGMAGPLECQSLAAMQSLMDTNFFGLVRLVKEVLPDMKRRRGGHIVVISSIMGLQGIVFNDIYAASKFAVEGFCESLVVQALRFNVAISLVEPGPVTTEFEMKLYEEAKRADYSRTDPETADIFTNLYLRNSRDVFASLGQTPEDIAEHTLRVIEAARPPFRHQTNVAYTPMAALKHADPSGALMTDAFYKLVFKYDAVLRLSLRAIRLLRWKAQKKPSWLPPRFPLQLRRSQGHRTASPVPRMEGAGMQVWRGCGVLSVAPPKPLPGPPAPCARSWMAAAAPCTSSCGSGWLQAPWGQDDGGGRGNIFALSPPFCTG